MHDMHDIYGDGGYDGVQYDTFYAPDPQQLEAEALRRECLEAERGEAEK